MNCRFCKEELKDIFVNLDYSPPSNSYLSEEELDQPEIYFPLKTYTCRNCFLVQIDEHKQSSEIFDNTYAYFSSYSTTWLKHAKEYVNMMIERFDISKDSLVIEVASNDGYLLQYFKEKNIPVLGIEPSSNTANVAIQKGIETNTDFFGEKLANDLRKQGRNANLIVGNNVLAHVPNINDFVKGLKTLLKKDGIITLEFPHLFQLVKNNQFDTIYHEHYSYLSLTTVKNIFESHNLELFDVDEIPTHGGSLRIYVKHKEDESRKISENVLELIEKELKAGMRTISYYQKFQEKVNKIKQDFLMFLLEQKKNDKKIVAYGAAAKGNTLINYCGIKKDLLEFVVDASPHKQGKFLPGSHIPVVNESFLREEKPDFIVILPWNIKDEIVNQLEYVKEWGCKFVVAIPELVEK